MIKQNLPMYTITTTLGSEIRKFTAVNSSLSAGIPVLVKLLYLMESCNVYSHSHRKSFFVFTNISALRIFCLSRAVLSLTSEISAEKSSAAHRRTVSNVPNVLAAILLQQWQTNMCCCHLLPREEWLEVLLIDWVTNHAAVAQSKYVKMLSEPNMDGLIPEMTSLWVHQSISARQC